MESRFHSARVQIIMVTGNDGIRPRPSKVLSKEKKKNEQTTNVRIEDWHGWGEE